MIKRTAVLVVLLLAFQAALATTYPLTVRDQLGHELTLTHPPTRIVSMIPSDTETVCALHACDALVGVDAFSDWPQQVSSLPHLGNANDPNIERLVALKPDLVLTDEYSGLAARLERLGIPVYAGTPQTYQGALDFLAVMGRLLDRETAAALVQGRIEGQVAAVAAKVADLPPVTVFVELDATPYSVGPGSYLGTLLRKAGGRTIVSEAMGQYPQVDPEYVVQQDPQVVLLMDAPYGQTVAKAEARPGWSALRAVRNGRVLALDQQQVDLLSRAGPRMGDAVVLLAKLLHPGRF
ncbi:MAG: helical backbone metal receptor [Deinococcales bacterium]